MSDATVKGSAVAWTPSQQAAITTTDTSILVSAAAGSGKTATLAERVAHLVCDEAIACPVDEILVLTFTEAAAAEMRARIEKSLARRTLSPFARRQLLLIGQANISTIHGFCARLLRRHFHLLGIDPQFAILDQAEATLMRQESVRAVLDAVHGGDKGGDRGEAFRALVEWFGDGDDERIATQVLAIHGLMGSIVDPAAWRREAVDRLEGVVADPATSELGERFSHCSVITVSRIRAQLAGALPTIKLVPKYFDYAIEHFEPLVAEWEMELAKRGAWKLTSPPDKLPSLPPIKEGVVGKAEAKPLMDALKAAILEGPTFAGVPGDAEYWKSSTASSIPHAREIVRLSEAFEAEYAGAKGERKGLDFGDLERMTLDLLRDASTGIAGELRRHFRFVLVDECQDINGVQDAIIGLLSGPDNLFCVGDVKQSIYQFRLAEPELFQRRREAYESKAIPGKVITLAENFRSRAPLLEAINAVFERLMVGGGTEIDYAAQHRLAPGPDFAASTLRGGPIELHVLQPAAAAGAGDAEDLEGIEREGECVAWRIRQMIAKETVFDRSLGTVRPARYGDIAVLLRVAKVKTKQFASQLRRHGIPVHADARGGLLEAQEVRDLLALLQLIDNPNRDIELATYLRSPLSLLAEPEEAMARARLAAGKDAAFHVAATAFAAGAKDSDAHAASLAAALGRVASWRGMALRRPCAEVLQEICDRTLYPAYVAGLVDGPQRAANIEELLSLAREYCAAEEGSDLAGFNAFVRAMEQEEAGPDNPSAPAEDGNVVRVMTVHKSKGLEFPVVFLPDLGKKFNANDLNGNVLVGKDCFLAPKAVDAEKAALYPSPAWTMARELRKPKLVAEELRVLYVAMTRAREQLIMVGTAPATRLATLAAWAEKPQGPTETEILGMNTALDWIYAAGLAAHAAGAKPVDFIEHAEEELAAWAAEAGKSDSAEVPREILDRRPLGKATPEALARLGRTAWTYPHDAISSRPATASVTSLTHTQAEIPARGDSDADEPRHAPAANLLSLPDIAKQTIELAATDRGTATHVALELLDYAADTTPKGIHAQLSGMVERETLSPRELAAIDIGALNWVLNSEIGPLLRGERGTVYRELPIYLPEGDGAGLDQQMVRGRIDLLVNTPEGPVVIDYKTDRVSGSRLEERVELYARQVAFYRRAAESLTGKACAGVYLAFIYEQARVIRKL